MFVAEPSPGAQRGRNSEAVRSGCVDGLIEVLTEKNRRYAPTSSSLVPVCRNFVPLGSLR
jgi:hypothetical protein